MVNEAELPLGVPKMISALPRLGAFRMALQQEGMP
jgi:hypothetical protein